MIKIFIVRGTTGEYSAKTTWTVRAFRKEEDAKALVLLAEEKSRQAFLKAQEVGEDAWYRDVAEQYFPELIELDSQFYMDYCGTNYFYEECFLE
jgi:hypothetical protein